jgi:D-alanine-D-alanine ligase
MIEKYKQPVLAEEFINGRELHVTVLEKNGKPWVLPTCEVVFNNEDGFLPILTYDGKWNETSAEYQKSHAELAVLEDNVIRQVERLAVDAYRYLEGRDYPRLDMRLRDGIVYVLEINNNPGIDFTNESGFGVSGQAAGFTFEGILSHIVENAYLRFNQKINDSLTA